MKRPRFRRFAYLLPQLWRALLTRPVTIRFPFGPLSLSPHFRGRVVVDAEKCIGCGRCVRDCPASGLVLERESKNVYRLIHFPDRCAYCGQCETSCTSGAIRQINEFVPATSKREALVEILVEVGAENREQADGDIVAECSPVD